MKRFIVTIKGVVQGVGFRPFVYNLAKKLDLNGYVVNNPGGVRIEAEGSQSALLTFVHKVRQEAPSLSYIDDLSYVEEDVVGYKDFSINESTYTSSHEAFISPDIAICEDCLREMDNPNDRRYLYPFINCTNCGPRFTITKKIPYDRINTTMHPFKMCKACEDEYNDPSNRRFHAQPIACSKCGPMLILEDSEGKRMEEGNDLKKVHALLTKGKIIAIKGLGGYHLACDAKNREAVLLLRKRKIRDKKPFALMAKNMDTVLRYCNVSQMEQELILDIKRPVVLLERKPKCGFSIENISADNNRLGIMLPYTPLHHLLFQKDIDLLVMTSGNKSGEPIYYKDNEAMIGLKNIADYFLYNDRDIYIRTDDSVTSVVGNKEYIIRRSRGYVPFPVDISACLGIVANKINEMNLPSVLALGGELKNTFSISKGSKVFLSHHIGDLENLETWKSFQDGIDHFLKIFSVNPEIITFDKHPEYLSTKYANEMEGQVKIPVQHHHAHIASCMAENGMIGQVIGIAFDGTGYGDDGNIWGGEFFIGDYSGFKRVAHFDNILLPGGEVSIKEPWRVALSYLLQYYGDDFIPQKLPFLSEIEPLKVDIVKQQLVKRINTPLTSSLGRLFDAVASLIGLCNVIAYEGQAAIRLEKIANKEVTYIYPYVIREEGETNIICVEKLLKEIINDLLNERNVSDISGSFHKTIAAITLDLCTTLKEKYSLKDVVLSGGVFQNRLLLELVTQGLIQNGFMVHTHSKVPANDGGIALGQAVIALRKYMDGRID